MSTAEKPARAPLPALIEGQRLDQPEFHRRYLAMPPGTRAELINGVVHMPSPVGIPHGESSVKVANWLGHYELRTPGVQVLDGATTILGRKSEWQPDFLMRVRPEFGGRTRDVRGFVRGGPELMVEISRTTRYVDLGPKLDAYRRAGVQEYVVRAMEPDEVIWHVMRQGRFAVVPAGAGGLYRSEVFPGLWLDPQALLANDLGGLLKTLELGLATPEHAAFVARLAASKAAREP